MEASDGVDVTAFRNITGQVIYSKIIEAYQQEAFIDLAIENVLEALRDGGILVVIILFLFLWNIRTTFITLTAIPLSIVMTALIFAGSFAIIVALAPGGRS